MLLVCSSESPQVPTAPKLTGVPAPARPWVPLRRDVGAWPRQGANWKPVEAVQLPKPVFKRDEDTPQRSRPMGVCSRGGGGPGPQFPASPPPLPPTPHQELVRTASSRGSQQTWRTGCHCGWRQKPCSVMGSSALSSTRHSAWDQHPWVPAPWGSRTQEQEGRPRSHDESLPHMSGKVPRVVWRSRPPLTGAGARVEPRILCLPGPWPCRWGLSEERGSCGRQLLPIAGASWTRLAAGEQRIRSSGSLLPGATPGPRPPNIAAAPRHSWCPLRHCDHVHTPLGTLLPVNQKRAVFWDVDRLARFCHLFRTL